MRTSIQLDHDRLRILLYRRNASELLLETDREGLRLPVISIPKHTRVAEQLTKTIKDEWNLDTYCLFPFCWTGSPDASIPFHVVELCSPQVEAPAAMRWLPATSLSPTDFPDQDDFTGIQTTLARFDQSRRGELRDAFAEPGWLQGVTEWVAAQAGAQGISLTGSFRQFNASPTFSLLRFDTDGPALWFKAVGEPNVHEFSITLALARFLPRFVPRVIGWRTDWNAWLSVETEGAHLDDTTPLSSWQQIAATLANLQIASHGHGLHLIDAGCRDIRTHSLLDLLDPFFDAVSVLMERQEKTDRAAIRRQEIIALAAQVRRALGELAGSALPDVLGHLDLNPGNILITEQRCILLDWAEACVGHPFLTFQYLLEWRHRICGRDDHIERALVKAYMAPWRAFLPCTDIAEDFFLAPLLAAFAYAATSSAWKNTETFEQTGATAHLCNLVRRMKREAGALEEGTLSCPS
jgi:hypothetical protein